MTIGINADRRIVCSVYIKRSRGTGLVPWPPESVTLTLILKQASVGVSACVCAVYKHKATTCWGVCTSRPYERIFLRIVPCTSNAIYSAHAQLLTTREFSSSTLFVVLASFRFS